MIYTINKRGNYGIIDPVPDGGLSKTLDKYLQYEKKGIEFMPNRLWGIVRFYNIKKGTFPFGLIKKVMKIMDKYCEKTKDTYTLAYSPKDYSDKLSLIDNIKGLRDYQKEAIKALIKNSGGVLRIATSGGKTITIIEYIKLLNITALIIVPTLEIKSQWEEYAIPNIMVSTYQNPKLRLKGMLDYELIVFDESHHVAAKTLFSIAQRTNTSTILIGVSASEREDGEEMRIVAALGDTVYNIDRKELIMKGYISDAEVIYLKPNFKTDGKYKDYPTVYNEEIILNNSRNKMIINIIKEELDE